MIIKCHKCKKDKDTSMFSVKSSSKRGYSFICKECHNLYVRTVWYKKNWKKQVRSSMLYRKNNRIKTLSGKYKFSESQIIFFENKAAGVCCICNKKCNLVLDHEHSGHILRGFICSGCNMTLGKLGDKKEDILSKIEKIKEYIMGRAT